MVEDPKGKIVQLMRNGTTPNGSRAAGHNIRVQGSGNVVAMGDVYLLPGALKSPRLLVSATPGPEHISTSQRRVLMHLVANILETEARLKKNPRSPAAIWSALNRHCGVPSYSLIARADYDRACSYLNKSLGMLNNMRSAPVKNGDAWRSRKIAYIQVNSKSPEDDAARRTYIMREFGQTSLSELSNDELEKTYRYVAGRRNKHR